MTKIDDVKQIGKKLQETQANSKKSVELWQNTKTPMTADMIYKAVAQAYPELFPDGSELVKLAGGDLPVIETKRMVSQ